MPATCHPLPLLLLLALLSHVPVTSGDVQAASLGAPQALRITSPLQWDSKNRVQLGDASSISRHTELVIELSLAGIQDTHAQERITLLAELIAQSLSHLNVAVVVSHQEYQTTQHKEWQGVAGTGAIVVYSQGVQVPYYGLQTPEALVGFVHQVLRSPVTTLEGKTHKKAFDKLEQHRVIGFFDLDTAELRAFEEAASHLHPYFSFHVVQDSKVAKKLKLKQKNTIHLYRPYDSKPSKLSPAPQEWDRILEFIQEKWDSTLDQLGPHDLHAPWHLSPTTPVVLVFLRPQSPEDAVLFKAVKTVAKDNRDNTRLRMLLIQPDRFMDLVPQWEQMYGIDLRYAALGVLDSTQGRSVWFNASEIQHSICEECISQDITSWLGRHLPGYQFGAEEEEEEDEDEPSGRAPSEETESVRSLGSATDSPSWLAHLFSNDLQPGSYSFILGASASSISREAPKSPSSEDWPDGDEDVIDDEDDGTIEESEMRPSAEDTFDEEDHITVSDMFADSEMAENEFFQKSLDDDDITVSDMFAESEEAERGYDGGEGDDSENGKGFLEQDVNDDNGDGDEEEDIGDDISIHQMFSESQALTNEGNDIFPVSDTADSDDTSNQASSDTRKLEANYNSGGRPDVDNDARDKHVSRQPVEGQKPIGHHQKQNVKKRDFHKEDVTISGFISGLVKSTFGGKQNTEETEAVFKYPEVQRKQNPSKKHKIVAQTPKSAINQGKGKPNFNEEDVTISGFIKNAFGKLTSGSNSKQAEEKTSQSQHIPSSKHSQVKLNNKLNLPKKTESHARTSDHMAQEDDSVKILSLLRDGVTKVVEEIRNLDTGANSGHHGEVEDMTIEDAIQGIYSSLFVDGPDDESKNTEETPVSQGRRSQFDNKGSHKKSVLAKKPQSPIQKKSKYNADDVTIKDAVRGLLSKLFGSKSTDEKTMAKKATGEVEKQKKAKLVKALREQHAKMLQKKIANKAQQKPGKAKFNDDDITIKGFVSNILSAVFKGGSNGKNGKQANKPLPSRVQPKKMSMNVNEKEKINMLRAQKKLASKTTTPMRKESHKSPKSEKTKFKSMNQFSKEAYAKDEVTIKSLIQNVISVLFGGDSSKGPKAGYKQPEQEVRVPKAKTNQQMHQVKSIDASRPDNTPVSMYEAVRDKPKSAAAQQFSKRFSKEAYAKDQMTIKGLLQSVVTSVFGAVSSETISPTKTTAKHPEVIVMDDESDEDEDVTPVKEEENNDLDVIFGDSEENGELDVEKEEEKEVVQVPSSSPSSIQDAVKGRTKSASAKKFGERFSREAYAKDEMTIKALVQGLFSTIIGVSSPQSAEEAPKEQLKVPVTELEIQEEPDVEPEVEQQSVPTSIHEAVKDKSKSASAKTFAKKFSKEAYSKDELTIKSLIQGILTSAFGGPAESTKAVDVTQTDKTSQKQPEEKEESESQSSAEQEMDEESQESVSTEKNENRFSREAYAKDHVTIKGLLQGAVSSLFGSKLSMQGEDKGNKNKFDEHKDIIRTTGEGENVIDDKNEASFYASVEDDEESLEDILRDVETKVEEKIAPPEESDETDDEEIPGVTIPEYSEEEIEISEEVTDDVEEEMDDESSDITIMEPEAMQEKEEARDKEEESNGDDDDEEEEEDDDTGEASEKEEQGKAKKFDKQEEITTEEPDEEDDIDILSGKDRTEEVLLDGHEVSNKETEDDLKDDIDIILGDSVTLTDEDESREECVCQDGDDNGPHEDRGKVIGDKDDAVDDEHKSVPEIKSPKFKNYNKNDVTIKDAVRGLFSMISGKKPEDSKGEEDADVASKVEEHEDTDSKKTTNRLKKTKFNKDDVTIKGAISSLLRFIFGWPAPQINLTDGEDYEYDYRFEVENAKKKKVPTATLR